VPVDPNFPAHRIAYMMHDSQVPTAVWPSVHAFLSCI
jgi:non-ribosomal peptide synthetase component F